MEKHKLFQWCPVQCKVVPVDEVQVRVPADIAHGYIRDEMPPTKNPLNPREIYTSKSKLRAAYKAAGVIEIGDAYDRGYSPEKRDAERERVLVNRITQQIRDRFNG